MKKILVTGAAGQIGSELVPALRQKYGNDNVVATYHRTPLPEDIRDYGPSAQMDILDDFELDKALKEYDIERIFHLSSILSALGEKNPDVAYKVNIEGLYNILNVAKNNGVHQVIVPSSIAAFGPDTPRDNTPNETIQRPRTMYGISKVFGELIGDYYFQRFGLDVRGVRFPGIISWKTEPTAGTTDYAVAIFYEAIRKGNYTSYLREDTRLPMMYMPDAIKALINLAEADRAMLTRSIFNVGSMSFTPAELADVIRKRIPEFEIDYKIDPIRQGIADSWPRSLDVSLARKDWNWKPDWDIESMANDMLENLSRKLVALARK